MPIQNTLQHQKYNTLFHTHKKNFYESLLSTSKFMFLFTICMYLK